MWEAKGPGKAYGKAGCKAGHKVGYKGEYKGYGKATGKAASSWLNDSKGGWSSSWDWYGKSYGKDWPPQGYGKGKDGKSKGKGKRSTAPDADDPYWQQKMEAEGRTVQEGFVYAGKILTWNPRHGWGLIVPDDPESLPKEVLEMLKQASAKVKETGKTVQSEHLLYFRKPDVRCEPAKDAPVTFQIYTDAKGAGACDINAA